MSNSQFAGFWLRFVAVIIDSIVVQVIQSFLILPILGILGFGLAAANSFDFTDLDLTDENIMVIILAVFSAVTSIILLSLIISSLYYAIMDSSKYQATLGKLALGLKVTDIQGKRASFVKALLRNVGKIISGTILMIGYIMAGFTDKKQALHDMLAGTLVVKK